MNNESFKHKSLSSIVVEYIRSKILSGEYKEGDHILEAEVAKELGTSRAPVREGIKELENQGLIKTIPRKGNYVVKLTMDDVKEVFDIRLLLENSVLEILINDNKLTEDDFQELERIIDDMIAISQEEKDEIHKILGINKKDMEFHKFLWQKSGSARRFKILSDLYSQLQMAMVIDTKLTGSLMKTAKDHYNIIKYLREKDLENCKKALKEHIIIYKDEAQAWRQQNPPV